MKKIIILCVIVLFFFACDNSAKKEKPNPAESLKSLRKFDKNILAGYSTVEDLKSDLTIVATQYLHQTIEKYADEDYWCWSSDTDSSSGVADSAEAPEGSDSSGENDYETNNQISGVDEADSVKSDGSYIYLINKVYSYNTRSTRSVAPMDDSDVSYSTTSMLASYNTAGTKIDSLSFTDKEFNDILISDTNLIAISSNDGYNAETKKYEYNSNLELFSLNAGKITAKKIIALPKNSRYKTARRINSSIYVISSAYISPYQLKREIYPWHDDFDKMDVEEYKAAAYAKMDGLVKTWCDDIVNSYFLNQDGSENTDLLKKTIQIASTVSADEEIDTEKASRLFYDPIVTKLMFVSVLSLDDPEYKLKSAATFCSDRGYENVYVDSEYVVLAHSGYRWSSWSDVKSKSFLSAFTIKDSDVLPSTIGFADGWVLNQFSIDRSSKYLRVASTTPSQWSYNEEEKCYEQTALSQSQITVLDLTVDEMAETGKVDGLGEDERIYSVRFSGDKAYVVTFKQIDPFYTIDLSDPANPKKMGELKVPGFSNYLHPISENYILGIGQQDSKFKIALYNVIDMSNPLEQNSLIEDSYSYSDATCNHHAFRYISSKNKIIVPLSYWNWSTDDNFSGFALYNLDISEASPQLSKSTQIELKANDMWYNYSYTEPRNMLIDGNYIFIKSGAIASYNSDTMVKNWQSVIE